jgi:hypothetical protein
MLFEFELLEASAHCEAFMPEADAACCAALEDVAFVAKSSDFEAFADRLLFEDRFSDAPSVPALFEPVVAEFAVLPVAFVELPPLAAFVLFIAEPAVPEELPPLEEVLLEVELPVVPALPPGAAVAVLAVFPVLPVLFELSAVLAAAFSVAAAVFASLAVSEPVEVNEFVVPLDLLALAAAEADSVAEALLLALAFWANVLLEVALAVALLVVDRSLEAALFSVVLLFSAVERLAVELLMPFTLELLFTVNWLFVPRV